MLGLGLISKARLGYDAGAAVVDMAQARHLAFCGLEDFRTKTGLDVNFPPVIGDNSHPFSYSEVVVDASGRKIGSYQVQCLLEKAGAPHFIYQLNSTGMVNGVNVTVIGYLENQPGLRWLGFEVDRPDWFEGP